MIKYIDRTLAVLLFLGAAVGHTYGAFKFYGHDPLMLFWALHASVLGGLLGILNFLRTFRPQDRALARITVAGTAIWTVGAARFGVLIGNPTDQRVVMFMAISLGLISLGLRTALGRAGEVDLRVPSRQATSY
jgi:hypothetical protein